MMEKKKQNLQCLKEPYPINLLHMLEGGALPNQIFLPEEMTADMIEGLLWVITFLPSQLREIVQLRFERKLTYSQIGVTMGITIGKARYLTQYALSKLRRPPLSCYIRYGKQGYGEHLLKIAEDKKRMGFMSLAITELNLSKRAENRLLAIGCESVADMVDLQKNEICNIKGIGKKTGEEIAVKCTSLKIADALETDIEK